MSLSRKLIVLLVLALGILLGVGLVTLRSRSGLIESSHRVVRTYEILGALDGVLTNITGAETGQRGFVITGDEAYLEPFNLAVERISGDLKRLDGLLGATTAETRERLDRLSSLIERKISLSREVIGRRRFEGFEGAAALVETDRGKETMDEIRRIIGQLRSRERERLVRRATLTESRAEMAGYVLIGGALASGGLILLIFVLLAREVRAHQRTARELRRHGAVSDAILSSMADGVIVADPDGRISLANPAAERLLGGTFPDATIGGQDRHPTVFRPDGRPMAVKELPIARAIHGASVDATECLARLPGRSEPIWLSVTARPLKARDGTLLGGASVFCDVTPQKQAELALKDSNANLLASVELLERRNEEVVLLGELSELLQACTDEAEASAIVAQSLARLLPHSAGALYLTNASRNLVVASATWGGIDTEEQAFAPDACWALRRGHRHVFAESRLGLRCKHVASSTAAYACVPMMAQGESLGVLHVREVEPGASKPVSSVERDRRQRLLSAAADEIALALANLRLRESLRWQSIRDPLTDLYNRRYMEESIDRELQRAARKETSVGVLVIDIDHFKRFNDSFGHDAGDALLCELGAVLRKNVRGDDLACRYGGEEFVVILPDASLEETSSRAEVLRDKAKAIAVRHHEQTLRAVTLSIGVAVFPQHGRDAKSLIHRADRALYRAKREGRDRVAVADPAGDAYRSSGTAA